MCFKQVLFYAYPCGRWGTGGRGLYSSAMSCGNLNRRIAGVCFYEFGYSIPAGKLGHAWKLFLEMETKF
jgi:hypothetical protein